MKQAPYPLKANQSVIILSPILRQIPEDGFLRQKQITGDKKSGLPPIIPVSRSTWLAGVKSGKFPASIKLGERTTAWRVSDIKQLIAELGGI